MRELRIGDWITFSKNKVTGDRSYTHNVWEITGVNDISLQIKLLPYKDGYNSFINNTIIERNEHDIALANDFDKTKLELGE